MSNNTETHFIVPESDWEAFLEMSYTDPAEAEDR